MSNIEEISEFLQPKRSILVLWDIQKMLVETIFNKDEFLKNVQKLAPAARSKDIPVLFTKITPLPERFESAARKFMMKRRQWSINRTPDAYDLYMNPERQDIVMNKNTADIFIGTNFELMLRNAGISTIVFTGISTEMGIESSARAAGNRGFFPVVVSDAVSSPSKEGHERSLANLKNLMPLVSAEDLAGFWK